jgi:hypothetical protein
MYFGKSPTCDLIRQAAAALEPFGLRIDLDSDNVAEFLRHIITAAATHGALCKRPAPRKRPERKRQGDDHVDGATYMSAS